MRGLVELAGDLRARWMNYLSDGWADELIRACAADHFDEGNSVEYRGTTYALPGHHGAAHALALALLFLGRLDPDDYQGLRDSLARHLWGLPEQSARDEILSWLEGRAAGLLGQAFDEAVANLAFFKG
jgi:hypothetical protein